MKEAWALHHHDLQKSAHPKYFLLRYVNSSPSPHRNQHD